MSQKEFLFQLYEAHRKNKAMPSPEVICSLITGLLQILFPQLSDKRYERMSEFEQDFANIKAELINILTDLNGALNKDVQQLADTSFTAFQTFERNY